jgi:ribose-phosphate pyrophosphokinase
MQTMGIQHVVTVDVHTPQTEGFFRIPIDDFSAVHVLADAVRPVVTTDSIVVSPDLGAVRRAAAFGELLGLPAAVCVKRRTNGSAVQVNQVIGDVSGKSCIIVDDMITTGGTVAASVEALAAAGAQSFIVAATHGVLLPGACEKMSRSGVQRVLLSDSIAPSTTSTCNGLPVERVSVAPLLAEVVRRLAAGESLQGLH